MSYTVQSMTGDYYIANQPLWGVEIQDFQMAIAGAIKTFDKLRPLHDNLEVTVFDVRDELGEYPLFVISKTTLSEGSVADILQKLAESNMSKMSEVSIYEKRYRKSVQALKDRIREIGFQLEHLDDRIGHEDGSPDAITQMRIMRGGLKHDLEILTEVLELLEKEDEHVSGNNPRENPQQDQEDKG